MARWVITNHLMVNNWWGWQPTRIGNIPTNTARGQYYQPKMGQVNIPRKKIAWSFGYWPITKFTCAMQSTKVSGTIQPWSCVISRYHHSTYQRMDESAMILVSTTKIHYKPLNQHHYINHTSFINQPSTTAIKTIDESVHVTINLDLISTENLQQLVPVGDTKWYLLVVGWFISHLSLVVS